MPIDPWGPSWERRSPCQYQPASRRSSGMVGSKAGASTPSTVAGRRWSYHAAGSEVGLGLGGSSAQMATAVDQSSWCVWDRAWCRIGSVADGRLVVRFRLICHLREIRGAGLAGGAVAPLVAG